MFIPIQALLRSVDLLTALLTHGLALGLILLFLSVKNPISKW